MIDTLLLLGLALLPAGQVDLRLEPSEQSALPGETVLVELVASSDEPEQITTIDAILAWDPARLDFVSATLVDFPNFVNGFLPDPDGINADLDDGEVLYTALAPLGMPATVPPDLVVVRFEFTVLTSACVELVPASGSFAETEVGGPVPGQDITGTLGPPALVEVPGTWSALGGALAGTGGVLPALTGEGALLPCDPWTLTLTDALPGGTAFFVLGFTNISVPFKGGVLVPAPDKIVMAPISPAGTRVLSGAWPDGVPGGFPIYLQVWIPDPGGFLGFAASNAVVGVTP